MSLLTDVRYTGFMNKEYLYEALEMVKAAVIEVGAELRGHYGNVEAEAKDNFGDLVTELDRKTEVFLAAKFKEFDPTIGFRGEEFGVTSDSDRTWLVDPIDGTTHFVRGLPFCTTMVALIDNGQIVLSVIYDFVNQDTYWAITGEGAYKNQTRLHVSDRPLRQSLLSYETNSKQPGNLDLWLTLRDKTNYIQTMNCGYEFAMIASGKLDGRIAKDPYGKDWDFAPGSLLVAEACGIVANLGKSTYDYTDHDYLMTNQHVYDELTHPVTGLFPVTEGNQNN